MAMLCFQGVFYKYGINLRADIDQKIKINNCTYVKFQSQCLQQCSSLLQVYNFDNSSYSITLPSMKDQQQHSQTELDLNNPQSCSYIWKKLKNSVFDVLFVLLDNSQDQESMFGLIFQTGVDYVQMMAFPFNTVVLGVWNANDTLNGVTQFFNNFNVSTYIPGVGFDTFLVLMYSLIFLILVVISDIVYVAYSFSKKRFRFTFPLIFMAKVVPIFVTVLFLPIMETLLQVVNCQNSEDGSHQVLQSFPDVVCWQGWHLFHTTVTLLFSLVFVFISCIVALALFEPRMTTNRLTARQNSTGQVVFIINKIICQFIFSFSPFEGSLPYCLLLFGLSTWLFCTYNVAQPYYDKRACKFFRICSSYYFWTNLMLLVSEILAPLGFQDGLVIWICGMIFIGITIVFQRKSNIDTLFASSLKFKSGQQLQSHLKYVLQLHHNKNQDKNSYMLLLGYIEKHIQLCLQQDCPLKYNKLKFATGKEEQQHSCKQLLKQIERMFDYGIKKYPECTKLRLAFAFFYMEKYDNTVKAYENFSGAQKTEPSFGEQFIIYRFMKIISEKLEENKQKNQEDLIQLIRFDNHVTLCQEGLQISGKLHKSFWLELKQQSPNLNRLNKIGAKIMQTSEMIKQNYGEVVKLSNDGLSILSLQYCYALYLLCICHEEAQGRKLLQIIKKKYETGLRKQQKQQKQDKTRLRQEYLQKNCVLTATVEKQTDGSSFCRILQVNRQTIQLTRYPQQELVNKKLGKLLPKIYEDMHDRKMGDWLRRMEIEQDVGKFGFYQGRNGKKDRKQGDMERSKENSSAKAGQYVGTEQIGYIKDSNGHVRKVKYHIYFLPLQCHFIAEMKIVAGQQTIICDPQGIILEISSGLLYQIPEIGNILAIENLTEVGITQELEAYPQRKISLKNDITSGSGRTKKYEFTLQLIRTLCTEVETQPQTNVNIDQLFRYSSQPDLKKLGIVVSVSEVRKIEKIPSVNSCRYDQTTHLNVGVGAGSRHQLSYQENKKINSALSGLAGTIDECYEKNMKESVLKVSRIAFNILGEVKYSEEDAYQEQKFKDYSKYYDNDNKQCTIKTFRYHNTNMTRIYTDMLPQQSQYDFEQKMSDLATRLSLQKIQDPLYQLSIKKALNTPILHPEVKYLYMCSLVVMVGLLGLLGLGYEHYWERNYVGPMESVGRMRDGLQDVRVVGSEMVKMLYHYGDERQRNESLAVLSNHAIKFVPPKNLPLVQGFILEDGSTISLTLPNALLRIQANLLRYLSLPTPIPPISTTLPPIYSSYLHSVTGSLSAAYEADPDVILQPGISDDDTVVDFMVMFLCGVVGLGVGFVVVWGFCGFRLKWKVDGILVWFLDVPFQYIHYAERQCLHFTKLYLRAEQSSETPMLTITKDTLAELSEIQQYNPEPNPSQSQSHRTLQNPSSAFTSSSSCQQQKAETSKSRKQLISRYRKKGLLTYLFLSDLSRLPVLLLMVGFMLGLMVLHEEELRRVGRVQTTVSLYAGEYVWLNAGVIVAKIREEKDGHGGLWPGYTQQLLQQTSDKISQNLLSSQKLLKRLREPLFTSQSLTTSSTMDIIEELTNFQFQDICSVGEWKRCGDLLDGRLKGGYSLFKKYILDYQQQVDRGMRNGTIGEIEQALALLTPPFFTILTNLLTRTLSDISSNYFIVSLAFYLYLILIIILFLLPWTLYLRKMNIQLNQTVQILNVIPMSLIPVGRRETRDFLAWVLREANQVGDQDEHL